MIEGKHDWTRFSKRIHIYASVKLIFQYWNTQDKLEKWFLSSAEFSTKSGAPKSRNVSIQEKDTYEWKWHGSDHLGVGEILNTNNKDHLSFTFLGCPVDVKITAVDKNVSLIELTQFEIPQDEGSIVSLYLGCSRGWTFYLTNLKSILEGGIDLRNKESKFENVINT